MVRNLVNARQTNLNEIYRVLEELDAKRLYKEGVSYTSISLRAGIPRSQRDNVVNWLTDGKPIPRKDEDKFLEFRITELYKKVPRLSYNEIAAEMGISCNKTGRIISRLLASGKIKTRFKTPKQEVTDLVTKHLRQITEYRGKGFTWKEIANQLHLSERRVYKLVSRFLPHLLVGRHLQ